MITVHHADPPHASQQGLAALVFATKNGRTRLIKSRTRPPLVVQRALYPYEAVKDMAFVFLSNPTGGLLQHDDQKISVTVRPGAQAHVTTQSATKIFTMPDGSAEQSVDLEVSEGGYLEYLPDPVIPFRGANFSQSTSISVAPGGTLIFGEVITPGRVAMGEAFAYCRLANRILVSRPEDRPVYRETYDLAPQNGRLWGLGIFGSGADPACREIPQTLGSMLILTDAHKSERVLEQLQLTLPTCWGVRAGASALPDGAGVGVKVIAGDTAAVQSALAHSWSVARRHILGVDTPFLRKY